jgi:hypothetical protein
MCRGQLESRRYGTEARLHMPVLLHPPDEQVEAISPEEQFALEDHRRHTPKTKDKTGSPMGCPFG